MRDLERAQALLREGGYTCVLCRGETYHTSTKRGVAPMLGFLAAGTDLRGFSAADKVVGKAPALLFVLAGVTEVYAPVMTEGAVDVFTRHRVGFHYDIIVPYVMNRSRTGMCPMEQTVREIDDPQAAYEAVSRKAAELAAAP